MQRQRLLWSGVCGLLLAMFFCHGVALAQLAPPISSSDNYKMVDSDFSGGTGGPSGCSSGYCNESLGAGAAGGQDDDGILEVVVTPGVSDLGTVSAQTTAKKTATVMVRNYRSYGYTMQVVGSAPKYGNHIINTLAVPTASQPGIEQFGINVVKNTSLGIGANPVQNPTDGTVFGTVTPDYVTADKFKYTSGDVVAQGASTMTETGQTTYTISMIMNISNTTPAGHYTTDLSVVVVPIY